VTKSASNFTFYHNGLAFATVPNSPQYVWGETWREAPTMAACWPAGPASHVAPQRGISTQGYHEAEGLPAE
jgi:hypothetical protein